MARLRRLTSSVLVVAVAAAPFGCRSREGDVASDEGQGSVVLADSPSGNKGQLADLSDEALNELVSSVELLFWPTTDADRLHSRLYWCAIYALWSAFPVGKLSGAVSLRTFIRQNASARGGRVIDVVNVLHAIKQLANGDDATLDQRLLQAFSLMQLLNHAFGGSKLVSGALNLVDTLSRCGLAIHDGSRQLIADINTINDEYSTREIWSASREALGPVAGPPVFVVIVGGHQFIKTGEAAGDWIGELAYPTTRDGGLAVGSQVQCCTVNRTYEYWNGIVWRKCDWNGDTWVYVQSREMSYPHDGEEHVAQGPRNCKGTTYGRDDVRMLRSASACTYVERRTCK